LIVQPLGFVVPKDTQVIRIRQTPDER
jgi:hypothetical protein